MIVSTKNFKNTSESCEISEETKVTKCITHVIDETGKVYELLVENEGSNNVYQSEKNCNLKASNKYPIPTNLRMYRREEVAELLACHKDNVVMLTEVGCLKAIKIGKRYMYSYESIKRFQKEYAGLDVSNRMKAKAAFCLVHNRNNIR